MPTKLDNVLKGSGRLAREELHQPSVLNSEDCEADVRIDKLSFDFKMVLAAGTMLVSTTLAYATLDKRVSIQEQLANERAARVEERLRDLQVQMEKMTQAINALHTAAARRDR